VVIKRDNPAKAGRLANELRNVARIVSRLGLADHKSVRVLSDSSSVSLAVVRPLSVIRTSNDGVCYSVMPLVPHPTLEAVLLAQTDAGERDTLLRKTRKLLDFLYANGIVWGDMAPRNILVEQTPTATVFHVLDFEKTDLLDGPVPDGHREAHARGPIFVEEFGAICSQDEVQRAFHPYFDPGSWDLDSEAPLALVKPKREIMALIGPHAQAVSTGQYNRVEREVLPARVPHLGADGRWRRPLHVSFRVDHYLDADHDRMTTEILMRAAAGAQFCQMVDVLDASIQLLENAMFLRQILRFLSFRVDDLDKEIRTRREELSALIVHLYRVSDDERQSANVVRTAGISHVLEKNRAAAADGVQVQRDNAAPVLAHLRAALSPVLDGLASALVVLYGGLAREEFGPASDLDIGVFCQDPALAARIREAIATLAGTELGLSVEFLPISNIEAIGKLAADAPDSIVDFLCGKVLGGPPDLAGRYQAAVSALCGDDACKLAARRYLDRHESLGKWHSAKQSLALLYLRAFVAGTLCDSASLADIASERAPLLWRKNEEAFSDNGKPAWSGGSQT
jgi:predicted nucleotidyltransferase